MKKKKITIIVAYNYDDKHVYNNEIIAVRLKKELSVNLNDRQEIIESIKVEDKL
ncbi:hypothetical protein [uncultured Bacteroides sp.]|uniref:hypothetical protein n=1 Tax=uncultured Bacteroides sp. TaxID=162156 RepID=UPI00374A7A76